LTPGKQAVPSAAGKKSLRESKVDLPRRTHFALYFCAL
jgi:hypothetical protein